MPMRYWKWSTWGWFGSGTRDWLIPCNYMQTHIEFFPCDGYATFTSMKHGICTSYLMTRLISWLNLAAAIFIHHLFQVAWRWHSTLPSYVNSKMYVTSHVCGLVEQRDTRSHRMVSVYKAAVAFTSLPNDWWIVLVLWGFDARVIVMYNSMQQQLRNATNVWTNVSYGTVITTRAAWPVKTPLNSHLDNFLNETTPQEGAHCSHTTYANQKQTFKDH